MVLAEPRPGLRSGHIPGSLSVPYSQLFDAATGAMKSLDDLRAVFLGAGVKLDAPIVTSCGSGITACVLALGLQTLLDLNDDAAISSFILAHLRLQ